MPSGFRVDADSWVSEFESCKALAQEVVQLIQERNTHHPSGGPEASRLSAVARKKLGTLGVSLDRLSRQLDTAGLSESEQNRRRDCLGELRARREQLQASLKRGGLSAANDREALLQGGQLGGAPPPRETETTAALDARGLLQLQQKVMTQQDEELGVMEKAVQRTKHIALAINDEVELQTRLLDDLDEDVDVTHTRLKAATLKVRQVLRTSSTWRLGMVIFLLVVGLVAALLVVLKVVRLTTPWTG